MRLILPALALLLLTACGLKDDLYLPDGDGSASTVAAGGEETSQARKETGEDDNEANP